MSIKNNYGTFQMDNTKNWHKKAAEVTIICTGSEIGGEPGPGLKPSIPIDMNDNYVVFICSSHLCSSCPGCHPGCSSVFSSRLHYKYCLTILQKDSLLTAFLIVFLYPRAQPLVLWSNGAIQPSRYRYW